MLEQLFSQDNLGYELELPEEPSVWTEEINRVLFTTFPELGNFPAKLVIDKFEPQKLYAKGSFLVDIAGNKLVIPVIIKGKKLQPFDVAIVNGEWHYLTNNLLTELINGNLSIGEPMDNKDTVDFYSQPLKNDVPYHTGSRNTRVITASALTSLDRDKLARAVVEDETIKQALADNPALGSVIRAALTESTPDIKYACVTRKGFSDAEVLYTDKHGKREKIAMGFAEAKAFVQKHCPDKYIDFIKTGSVCMLDDASSEGAMSSFGIGSILKKMLRRITGPGMFSAMGENGPISLMVIKIKSIDKNMPPEALLGISRGGLLHNVADTEAVPSNADAKSIISSMDEVAPEELRDSDEALIESEGDYLEPITVKKVVQLPIGKVIIGETKATAAPFTGIILSKYDHEKMAGDFSAFIPQGAKPLLLSSRAKFYKVASNHNSYIFKSAREMVSSATTQADLIKVMHRGGDMFAIKTASESITCSANQAPYYLAALGAGNSSAKVLKQAEDEGSVVLIGRPTFKLASKLSDATKKKISSVPWLKVAAYLESEESVDSALALDYLDSLNGNEFLEALPVYKKALSEMAKLMVSVRLGNEVISEAILKAAMSAMSDMIEELSASRG